MLQMRRVIIFCGDVERCGEFYRDVLGLTPLPSEHPASEWMEFDAGGCRLSLHQAYGPDGAHREPTGGPENSHKVTFYAEDVAAARQELVTRGAEMDAIKAFGELQVCDGSDPEGHRIQISNR